MVPGIFPSQLEILSTGRTYFDTHLYSLLSPLCFLLAFMRNFIATKRIRAPDQTILHFGDLLSCTAFGQSRHKHVSKETI